MIYNTGVTSQSCDIQIVDDTGLPVLGLVAATFPSLTYSLAGANADVSFPALSDLATITTAYSSGGVKERGNGYYRLDLPNGVFTSAGIVTVRGEASGKHALLPKIDVGVVVASVNSVVPLTGAATATAVWQDATGSDFTVASSIGKSLYTTGNAPGAASGLLIAGSNAATTFAAVTVSGATTLTGNVSLAAGLTITQSSSNTAAVSITGNGSGAGILSTGGATGNGASFAGGATSGAGFQVTGGATGNGFLAQGGSAGGDGFKALSNNGGNGANFVGNGAGDGFMATGGATGRGGHFIGGATSGAGLRAEGTAGTSNGFEGVGSVAGGGVAGGNAMNLTGGASTSNSGETAGYGCFIVGGAGSATTNGSGPGVRFIGGGTTTVAGAAGFQCMGTAANSGVLFQGGATGPGALFKGGATSNVGLLVTATSGDAIQATGGTNGNGMNLTGAGTGDGLLCTGGASGIPSNLVPLVWDVTLASHLTAGSTGFALNAAGSAGDPWATALPGSYTSGQAGFIVGTNLNATITSRASATVAPSWYASAPTAATVATTVWQDLTAGSDFTVTGSIGKLLAALPGSVWDVVNTSAAHNVTNSTGKQLRAAGGRTTVIYSGTARGGSSSTIQLDTGASSVDNAYQYEVVSIIGGTGAGQSSLIKSYVGSTRVATVEDSFSPAPDATSVFEITPTTDCRVVTYISGQAPNNLVWQDLTAGSDFTVTGSIGKLLVTDVDAAISSRASATVAPSWYATAPTAASIATAVWTDLTAGGDFGTAGSIGLLVVTNLNAAITSRASATVSPSWYVTPPTTVAISTQVWSEALPGSYGAGTAGNILGTGLGTVTGVPITEALRRIGAVVCGVITDAGTNQEDFADWSGAPCVTVATPDAQGDRTTVIFH
jgi:hypothetical protein